MIARSAFVMLPGLAIVLSYSASSGIATSFSFVSTFAQEMQDPIREDPARLNGAGGGQPRLDAIDSDIPLLENVSEKGMFRVQLRWPEVPLNPDGAFQIQAVFLNATTPPPSPETIPQSRTIQSGQSPTDLAMMVIPRQ